MVRTEAAASEAWCPMVRFPGSGNGNLVGAGGSAASGHPCCMGTRCMMWRWAESEAELNARLNVSPAAPGRLGYCGLAGTPSGAT
jgi:hypothetical protein